MMTKAMKYINHSVSIGLLFFSASVFAQTSKRYVDIVFTTPSKITKDIQYGSNTDYTSKPTNLMLDFYEPQSDTAKKRPLIIVAHEGSFLFGDKADAYAVNYANRMVKRGYCVASINYREGWAPNPAGTAEDNSRAIIPAAWRAIQDYKAAIRFFRKDAATSNTYKIDPEKIVGAGFGAGAYLPINGQIIDLPSEFQLASLRQKDKMGNPTNTPYIDTTKADLGGIFDTKSGSPGYSFKVPVVLIYSGAIIDTLLFNAGTNPLSICAHGDEDQTTPYKTAVVNAQLSPDVLIPIILVHGSYQVTRILDKIGVNSFFNKINYDKFPQFMIPDDDHGPLNMYKKGVYTFVGQSYMPWDSTQSGYETTYQLFMDTLVRYTAPRLAAALHLVKLADVSDTTKSGIISYAENAKQFISFPNPSAGVFKIRFEEPGIRNYEVEIYNNLGQLIFDKKDNTENELNLTIPKSGKGLYLLKIRIGEQVLTEKLLIE